MSGSAVIVNPNAGKGRANKNWPSLQRRMEARLGPLTILETTGEGDAERLTGRAIKDGFTHIIAIGGDGTVNEALNGYFSDTEATPINPDACLSFLTGGTGNDFVRSFDWPKKIDAQLERIATAAPRKLDVGMCCLTGPDNTPVHRYFANIGSFGISGNTCLYVLHGDHHKQR